MKRTILMTGILLMLLLSGNASLSAQQNMEVKRDTMRLERPGMYMRHDNMHGRMAARENGMRYGMRGDQFYGREMRPYDMRNRYGAREFGGRGMGPNGMRDGFRGREFDNERPFGPGIMRIESIVTLTEKQKQDIEALRQKQMEEMKKVRDEMSEKMKVMRENNRKAVLGLLTDEQKKQLEKAR